MYVLCLMLYVILNNTIHGVEQRWREKREEKQGCKYFNASCVTFFFTFETDAAGKYLSPKTSTEGFPFNHAICVYKYLKRSMASLNMTVLKVTIYLF